MLLLCPKIIMICIVVYIQIQAVTIIGGGNYSDPVFFNVTGQGITESALHEAQNALH